MTLADVATLCAYGDACESLPQTGFSVSDLLLVAAVMLTCGLILVSIFRDPYA